MYNFLKNRRVQLFITATIISVILIASLGLNFGLDIEGGSWIQLEPNGAVAEIEIDSGLIVEHLVQGVAGTVTIVSIAEDEIIFTVEGGITQSQMDLLGMGSSEIVGNQVTLSTANHILISAYLKTKLDSEVIPLGDDRFEIRTAVSENNLNELVNNVDGTVTKFISSVTAETRDLTKEILNHKINIIGFKDIPIRTVGEHYILIDFAGIDLSTARDLVESPGRFEIRIQKNANESIHVLYGEAIESVDTPRLDERGQWGIGFRLSETGAHALRHVAMAIGATENPEDHWLMMYLDDDMIYSAPLSREAAASLRDHPIFSWMASTGMDSAGETQARNLHMHLRAGALPVDVDILASGEVDARLGEQFKSQSILIGFVALLTVALVVFLRYRKKEILVPMIGIAITEVLMILGIASIIGWHLDLSSIAGIIASVGTGIDHLIIVTDEVLYEGKLPTTKVYLSRVSKAFGIIIAAALTTMIAMAPLVVMGFGALKGFAIITILGVLIGILITRPVYGIIIKELLEKKDSNAIENS